MSTLRAAGVISSQVGCQRKAWLGTSTHVLAPGDFELQFRGHVGQELAVGVVDVDDDAVGDDVLLQAGVQADLRHVAGESAVVDRRRP